MRCILLLGLLLTAAGCGSSGETTTTTSAPPPPAATTAVPPLTTAPQVDGARIEVDTTGVRPRRVEVEEGATAVTFVNLTDRDFEVRFQGGDPPQFPLLAGETATVDFAGLPGGIYAYRALLGNASFPGTIDASGL